MRILANDLEWLAPAADLLDARLDPACATGALARAQLMLRLEHRDIARTLADQLELSASADADPARRVNTLATALAASAGDASVRLKLAIALLACDPPAALAHTRIVVEDLPLNVTGWTAHAHALVAAGAPDEADAFVQARLALARRVTVDAAQLAQLSAVVAPVAA
jgi:hypothetical protein